MYDKDFAIGEIDNLIMRYPSLASQKISIAKTLDLFIECYVHGGKLLICGNGGSAADALHIVGELMKGFVLPRKITGKIANAITANCEHSEYFLENLQCALPAIALVGETALMTAFSNDKAADLIFAQQVLGYGKSGDVLLGISTSGNSANVIYAAEVAHSLGMKVIGLTGKIGGKLLEKTDVCIRVPEVETYKIQELHLPVYHALCLALEKYLFGDKL